MTGRQEYINGLRRLAEVLEADESLPLPQSEIAWPLFTSNDDDAKAQLAKIARLMTGAVRKDYDDDYFRMTGSLGGLPMRPWAMRDQVCVKVVKGTKEITEQVPTGYETVTTTVDDVEWVCEPLLAEATS